MKNMKTVTVMYLSLILTLFVSCGSPFDGDESGNPWKPITNPQELTESVSLSRGANFSAWFEANAASYIPRLTTWYTERDFMHARSMGMDVIRLPIRMHSMAGGAPDYTLDPYLLKLLDEVVDWAEKYKLFIILDNHSAYTNEAMLISVWTQMAEHFKDRSRFVVYEVLSEPILSDPENMPFTRWRPIQGRVIDAIRKVDRVHTIVVESGEFLIEPYADPNLIYTFHFYDPFLFSHSGKNWGEQPYLLTSLKDLPFPGDAHAIPPLPDILRGTWIEDRFKSYASDATEAKLAAFLDKAVDYAKRYNVKVYCGEFGALMENNLREDRVRYYRMVTRLLDERNIARTSWNYYGSMGIFNSNSARNFYSELNVDIVEAMGFIAPPQEAPATIKTGFTIYDDYPGNNVEVRHWGWKEQNFYLDNTDAAEGRYAIKWSNPVAYEQFNWVFLNTVDWKSLLNSGYAIRFKAKAVLGESASGGPAFAFDVRFVDRQTEASPPWRMRYRITEAVLPPDGGWHTVTIPLADMRESGAFWDGSWYGPEGKFDWGTIECLEFSWENDYTLKGDIRFDAIEITRDY